MLEADFITDVRLRDWVLVVGADFALWRRVDVDGVCGVLDGSLQLLKATFGGLMGCVAGFGESVGEPACRLMDGLGPWVGRWRLAWRM